MKESYYENETQRAERNINKTLMKELRHFHAIDEDSLYEVKESLLGIHGMGGQQMDYVGNCERIGAIKDINTISIDDNSNKKDISANGIHYEASLPYKKLAGYNSLYKAMRNLYGKEKAKDLSAKMYTYRYALADSSNISLPYCISMTTTQLLYEGRPFGQLPSEPTKHFDTYIAQIGDVLHHLSGHLAGAIAFPTFFIDSAILLLKDGFKQDDLNKKDFYKDVENGFQRFIFTANIVSRPSQDSPFTNVSIFEKEKLRPMVEEVPDFLIKQYQLDRNEILEFTLDLQNIFTEFFTKGNTKKGGSPFRFPVLTANFNKSEIIKDINKCDELKEFVSKYDFMKANIFLSEGTKICSCYRMLQDEELMQYASTSNSFGAGATGNIGSHRVVTLNLYRLLLELVKDGEYSKENYLKKVELATHDVVLILKAHREMLKKDILNNHHKYFNIGWLSIQRLFSTIGLIGYWELVDSTNKDWDLLEDTLKLIDKMARELSKKFEMPINIEQIPAESMSHKLAKADKLLFGTLAQYDLYSNQFIPMWEKGYSIWDRIKTDGRFNSLITGGGIVHIQVNGDVTPSQAMKIIKFAAKNGCEHIAFGGSYATCENGHTHKATGDKCIQCGGDIVENVTRVVGFFTEVSSWSPKKRELDFKRRVHYQKDDLK